MNLIKETSARFVVGIKDFVYSKDLEIFLKNFPVSGIAIFNSPYDSPDNLWKNPEAALEALYEFRSKLGNKINFVAADQEGGRVRRLRKPFVELPSAEKLANSFEDKNQRKKLEEVFRFAAKQMALSGITLNFAPVCDLRYPESHTGVIGDRSFGTKVDDVLPFVELFCRAFRAEGVRTTLKHLPGHGATKFDTHEKIAVLFKPKKEIDREDLQIFLKVQKEADAIMPGHLAFEEFPDRIFSLDKEFIEEYRKKFSADLAWFTDDLQSMKAVSELKPWLKAFQCGYDFLLLCGTLDQAANSIEETIREAEFVAINFADRERIEKHFNRSSQLFKSDLSLKKFPQWKQEILELSGKANDILVEKRIA